MTEEEVMETLAELERRGEVVKTWCDKIGDYYYALTPSGYAAAGKAAIVNH